MSGTGTTSERVLRGIPVSNGVCRGKVLVLSNREQTIPHLQLSDAEVPEQIHRFQEALMLSRRQIQALQHHLAQSMGATDAMIFDAHLLLLEDPMITEEVLGAIQRKRMNAEFAFQQVTEKYSAAMAAMEDEYLRERVSDLKDVTSRVLNNLMGCLDEGQLGSLSEPCIIVSQDLTPSTTAALNKKMVLGFATDIGSRTSHTAIMARAMQIPAVVALEKATLEIVSGQYALLDGFNGIVILNPTDQTLFEYGQLVRKQLSLHENLRDLRDQPALTLDGNRLLLSANVEGADDTEAVKVSGAEGVGLFRTEYLFLNRDTAPTEEEQYQEYQRMAEALKPHPVVIRTLDLGGDKFLSHVNISREASSFYGWRAIRFCLQQPEVFKAQLRAILRASVSGNVKLMYPMISGIHELDQANALLEQCQDELRRDGVPYDHKMEIGAMIEIPSAALAANALAKRVKFFSIGTNDLIQYTLAVDRMNEKVAHLYEPTHPSVLQLIHTTVLAAHQQGLWVGVCGEMAGDPVMTPLLLGLGVDELSASPAMVPQIKFIIRRLKMPEARELAEFALGCECGQEILRRSQNLARAVAPSLFDY
ncbi:MAG: phosphoenolpyruvate--protein phosphotransferase [Verrucomicrobiota bacterium]